MFGVAIKGAAASLSSFLWFSWETEKKIVISTVLSPIWWLPPFHKALEQEQLVAGAALAPAELWIVCVSALLLCNAQRLSVVGISHLLFLSQNLGICLGAGRTDAHADWREWRGGDVWQSLRLWLRYQAIGSGKPRLPRSRLAASM